ncbi:hypothetical protein ART_2224 [Arthrobacter sp. PAMC 25486]|nr:hypothetical protein ART_2224 [Arthrobacter sp. PAMC 25486]
MLLLGAGRCGGGACGPAPIGAGAQALSETSRQATASQVA